MKYKNVTKGKRCAIDKCGEFLPLSAFGTNKHSPDGLHYYCKECAAEKQRVWAHEHPDRIRERNRWQRQRRQKRQMPENCPA